jgi:hypothetical protein
MLTDDFEREVPLFIGQIRGTVSQHASYGTTATE